MNVLKSVCAFGVVVACVGAVHAADPYVNVTVGGQISPGVYGRVDIGTAPPPQVYSPKPVIIAQPGPAVVVPAQPVYLHVPPGHRKHWDKHCSKYNACGVPVYFVRVDGQGRLIPAQGPGRSEHGDRGRGEDRGEGHGHGHGRGRD